MIPTKKFNFIKKQVQQECQNCKGSGCLSCRKKISRMNIYANAGIPLDYWHLPFKDFAGNPIFKDKIKERIQNIDKMYAEGESLGFVGSLGTGKTYAACCILKKAAVTGYSTMYVNMADVVNQLVSKNSDNHQYLDKLINIDFLVIDEFDKRWVFPSEKVEQLFGQTLEHILRCRFQNQMPTILCSNTENIDNVLSAGFREAFSSLRHKYLKVITVGGRDFRKCR